MLPAVSHPNHADEIARRAMQGETGSEPIAASTVILVRDSHAGLQALMLRKNSKIAFGGMWVFPGGRVDPEDSADLDAGDELGAARRAAVREAMEESALAVAEEEMLTFAHWTPPPIQPRRFLTWFFLAAAPESKVVIDDGEILEHAWMGPTEALGRRDAGEIEIAPPTFVSLFELASWPTVADALAAVRVRTPERFATRISVQESGPVALWHGDVGWEAGDAALDGPRHRLTMARDGWRYERET
jgi:8-oxo-dGTP pyrophosphatase MutT (NUDIX family)